MTVSLSVMIPTMNEARNIGACLDSVVGWAADIVVVDSGSTDGTLDACARRGVATVFHAFTDHASQLHWALTSIPWKHEWLLLIDADNVVTPEFRAEVEAMLRHDTGAVDGYYSRHVQYFRNRPIRGVNPRRLRLVRRPCARVDHSELVDSHLTVDGRIGRLSGAILENNENELDIDFWIDKQQRFARRLAVEEILRAEALLVSTGGVQPRLTGPPHERLLWLKNVWRRLPLYVRPGMFFVYRYVFRGGFLSGWNGFVFHALQSFWFRLLVDLHIDEYRSQLRRRTISIDDLLRQVGLNAGGSDAAPRHLQPTRSRL